MFDYSWEDMFKPEDEATLKAKRTEAKSRVLEVIEAGKSCLTHPNFKMYRERYEKAQASIVTAMILYTNDFFAKPDGDMALYGANMARFMTRITTLRALLGQVESDVKKEIINAEGKK